MWLNKKQISDAAIKNYRASLKTACPKHIVIDGLFVQKLLDEVVGTLQKPHHWQQQRHTYAELYVDDHQWTAADQQQRFVQRDSWRPNLAAVPDQNQSPHLAREFLAYLRSEEFLALLSKIFTVDLTDLNVAEPALNTNYFRLSSDDFVTEHADDSPGREVCMLLYLNKQWQRKDGGELVFSGKNNQPIVIPPLYHRCVLFDPSSVGSEHWVNKVNAKQGDTYRYNLTSWYWRE